MVAVYQSAKHLVMRMVYKLLSVHWIPSESWLDFLKVALNPSGVHSVAPWESLWATQRDALWVSPKVMMTQKAEWRMGQTKS